MSWRDASLDPTREIPLFTSCFGILLRRFPEKAGEGRVWALTTVGGSGGSEALLPRAEERRADSLNVFFQVRCSMQTLALSWDYKEEFILENRLLSSLFSQPRAYLKAVGNVHTHREEAWSLCWRSYSLCRQQTHHGRKGNYRCPARVGTMLLKGVWHTYF